jgi:hypothetical protein
MCPWPYELQAKEGVYIPLSTLRILVGELRQGLNSRLQASPPADGKEQE